MSYSNFADIIMDVPGRRNTLVLICVSCIFIIRIDGKIFRSDSTDTCSSSPYAIRTFRDLTDLTNLKFNFRK